MIKKIIILSVCVFMMGIGFNQSEAEARLMPHQGYELWAKVLKEYVNDQGLVDYARLQKNRADLDAVINQFKNTNVENMTKTEQKAFWINAYNALTMQLIVDKYPLKLGGIRTINWGRPWSIKMRVAHQDLTLGDIEHNILRKWDPPDPRVHFALNCASIGCPKLPKQPFDPQRLDEQLDFETRRFMSDPEKVNLNKASNVLYHSDLLNWYEDDFLVAAEDKLSYIKKYLNEEDRAYLDTHKVTLKKIKYDWGLNDQ